jgi:outer membrane protein OmpA-like peptidoglycan-associated protein
MSFDLLESLNSVFGGSITRELSASLGESEDRTHAAVRTLGPTALAALMQQVATPAGANDVFRAVIDDRVDAGIIGKLGALLGNRGSLDATRTLGESLAGGLFGNRTGVLANALSQVSGVKPGSALSLLSLTLPVVFGILKKQLTTGSLGASGLSSLLFSQRSALERTGLDSRITDALGAPNLSSLLSGVPAVTTPARDARKVTAARKEQASRTWLPWAAAAAIAVLSLFWFVNRTDNGGSVQITEVQSLPSPDARTAGTQVYFESGETAIDSEDRIKIASIASTVKRENRPVTVTGYTDRSGDPDLNEDVAKNRAVAVRDALVAEGVSEGKIVLDPPAQATGSGSAAEARRVDIEVR